MGQMFKIGKIQVKDIWWLWAYSWKFSVSLKIFQSKEDKNSLSLDSGSTLRYFALGNYILVLLKKSLYLKTRNWIKFPGYS